ncbi:MAG: BtpA/SgcQ family protein [Planctomycetes bacterium]|nr:BtpA/SgcQ family protein [Planctomycetota bacterium]
MAAVFGHPRPLLGMIHLGALPGSPGYGGDLAPVIANALADARALEHGKAHGLVVENFGDAPFTPSAVGPETIAAMTRVLVELARRVKLPMGVNCLRNDARGALAIAAATGAAFIRVNVHLGVMATDQGIVEGMAHETLRYRRALGLTTRIFADILVKHATPLYERTLEEMTEELLGRGRVDALIVTGRETGSAPKVEVLRCVRAAAHGAPVLVGSGLTASNVKTLLAESNGAIVGTSIKQGGVVHAPIDPGRVRELVARAAALDTQPAPEE